MESFWNTHILTLMQKSVAAVRRAIKLLKGGVHTSSLHQDIATNRGLSGQVESVAVALL